MAKIVVWPFKVDSVNSFLGQIHALKWMINLASAGTTVLEVRAEGVVQLVQEV